MRDLVVDLLTSPTLDDFAKKRNWKGSDTMAVAKKPLPAVKKQAPAPARKPRPAPQPQPEEIEEGEEMDDGEEEQPQTGWKGARTPQAPVQQQEDSDGQFEKGFPSGSMFEGQDFIIFQGTFDKDELHALIEQASGNSTDPDKVRVKIFDVDDKYQKGPQRRVRLNISGLQARRMQGGGGQKKSWGGRSNKKW